MGQFVVIFIWLATLANQRLAFSLDIQNSANATNYTGSPFNEMVIANFCEKIVKMEINVLIVLSK